MSPKLREQVDSNELRQSNDRPSEAIALLQVWIDEGDREEQENTGNELIRGLNEERSQTRLLFPSELERITW